MSDAPQARLIECLQYLFHDVAERLSPTDPARPFLDDCTNRLGQMARRLTARRFVAAVVGLTKVGKSTLLSALLGEEVAPRRNTVWSSVPVEYEYGEAFRAWVHFRKQVAREALSCRSGGELLDFIGKAATEGGRYSPGLVELVEARMPSPLLANGLVVADTPGFGAAQPGRADAETHAKVIVEYLNRLNARKDAFAQVYWVVRRGEGGIGSLEKRFYQEHLCGRCADVVVNYFGPEDGAHADPASQSKFRRRYGDCFDPLVRLHFLDGMQALEARKSNDAMALGSSGIQTLVDSMSAMAGNAYAHQAVRDVLAIWGDLHAALDRNLIDASRLWTIKKSRRDEAYYQAEQCGIPLKELDA